MYISLIENDKSYDKKVYSWSTTVAFIFLFCLTFLTFFFTISSRCLVNCKPEYHCVESCENAIDNNLHSIATDHSDPELQNRGINGKK